jgi:hypothetical protein
LRPTPSQRLLCVNNTSLCCHLSAQLTQDGVCGDRAGTARAIAPVRLDGELPLLARAHVQETLVPALDDLSRSDVEGERLATVVTSVKLAAVLGERSAVMYVDLVAGDGLTGALLGYGDLGLEVLGGVSSVHFSMFMERTSLLMMSATAAVASARIVATFILNKRRVCAVSEVLCVCTKQWTWGQAFARVDVGKRQGEMWPGRKLVAGF